VITISGEPEPETGTVGGGLEALLTSLRAARIRRRGLEQQAHTLLYPGENPTGNPGFCRRTVDGRRVNWLGLGASGAFIAVTCFNKGSLSAGMSTLGFIATVIGGGLATASAIMLGISAHWFGPNGPMARAANGAGTPCQRAIRGIVSVFVFAFVAPLILAMACFVAIPAGLAAMSAVLAGQGLMAQSSVWSAAMQWLGYGLSCVYLCLVASASGPLVLRVREVITAGVVGKVGYCGSVVLGVQWRALKSLHAAIANKRKGE